MKRRNKTVNRKSKEQGIELKPKRSFFKKKGKTKKEKRKPIFKEIYDDENKTRVGLAKVFLKQIDKKSKKNSKLISKFIEMKRTNRLMKIQLESLLHANSEISKRYSSLSSTNKSLKQSIKDCHEVYRVKLENFNLIARQEDAFKHKFYEDKIKELRLMYNMMNRTKTSPFKQVLKEKTVNIPNTQNPSPFKETKEKFFGFMKNHKKHIYNKEIDGMDRIEYFKKGFENALSHSNFNQP